MTDISRADKDAIDMPVNEIDGLIADLPAGSIRRGTLI
jgi:hypothetical protein